MRSRPETKSRNPRPDMKRLALGLSWLTLSACQAHVTPAAAQTASVSGVKRTLVAHGDLPDRPGWESRMYLIEFPPGETAKLHVHPVLGVGYVIEGSFESSFSSDPATVTRAGEGFVDLAGVPHRFRNPDPARWLRFVVAGSFQKDAPLFQLLPQ